MACLFLCQIAKIASSPLSSEKQAVSELCFYFNYFLFYFILLAVKHKSRSAPCIFQFLPSSRNFKFNQHEFMNIYLSVFQLRSQLPMCSYSQQVLWGKINRREEVIVLQASTYFSLSHHPAWLLQAPLHSIFPSKFHLYMTSPILHMPVSLDKTDIPREKSGHRCLLISFFLSGMWFI